MLDLYDKIQAAVGMIRSKWDRTPRAGIILGTGLGGLVQRMRREAEIDYGDVPHFLKSTAISHRGRLVCGELEGQPVIAMEGRFHMYEGYSLK
jgi:purine-nucleoside phosphorylase